MHWKEKYSQTTLAMRSSLIMDLIGKTKGIPGFISFAGGTPSAKSYPKHTLAQLFKEVVEEAGDEVLQYGASGGDTELKQAIIDEENPEVSLDEIQICSGAANGIYNLTRTLIDPGDYVVCESPSFLGSLVTFEAAGARLLPVDLQKDGMDLEQLLDYIKKYDSRKIKFIYTIPDFQNPTGITWSSEKREKLVEIAINNGIYILEDDPYSKLRLAGEPELSLFEIARQKYNNPHVVIAIRSFSKLLGPGLRIAYAIADKQIITFMNSWLQKGLNMTERTSQQVVAAFLKKGFFPGLKETIAKINRPLLQQMLASLEKYMPAGVKWSNPQGGMFVWVQLPEEHNTDKIFEKAVEKKAAFLPGSNFYPPGYQKYNGMRLNFTFPAKPQIDEGICRLASVIVNM